MFLHGSSIGRERQTENHCLPWNGNNFAVRELAARKIPERSLRHSKIPWTGKVLDDQQDILNSYPITYRTCNDQSF